MQPGTKLFFGFMLLIFGMLSAACSSKMFTAEGKLVAEERRLDLKEGGPYPRDWKGKNRLTIKYEYIRKQDNLQIMGDIVFNREKNLNDFRCSIVLIDAAGKVILVEGLVVAGGRQKTIEIPFKKEMQLPPGAHSMAFSYSGTSGGTGNSGSPNSFWFAPWS
jgi:hypothetical protein